jgi:hypothetical protein
MATGWEQYIPGMLQNKQLPDGNWLQNVIKEAAIILHNGTIVAMTPGFSLGTYKYDIQLDELTKKPVDVNETQILLEMILNGKSTICEAGIRINNAKYMVAQYDPAKKLAYLSKSRGGACAMATKSVIIFAAYSTEVKMSDGREQQAGLCNEVVEKLADFLIKNGS